MMTNEHAEIAQLFTACYGRPASAIARAPGRIEFIGNHTDYNGGSVLGAAIDRFAWVAVARNFLGRIRLTSTAETRPLDIPAAQSPTLVGRDAWAKYPLGVWQALKEFNLPRPNDFDLLVHSNLPIGAGMSSSAALELATALALSQMAGRRISEAQQLAVVSQHAERVHVGVPCGILDQGTSAFGREGHLIRIDCRGPHFSSVPIPQNSCFWIFDTREKHVLTNGLYALRHRECQDAARLLGIQYLTDFSPTQLEARVSMLPPTLARRARHVVTEHDRVLQTCKALAAQNLTEAGLLLTQSHRSSQQFFENSTPALDALADALVRHPQVYGARLTGGGFGGAAMAWTTDEFNERDAQKIVSEASSVQSDYMKLKTAPGADLLSSAN